MFGDQSLELGHERGGVAQREQRVDAVLPHHHAQLVETDRDAPRPLAVGELLERRAPEARERGVERVDRGLRVGCALGALVGELETARVDQLLGHLEHVARWPSHDLGLRAQQPAQPGDLALQHRARVGGQGRAPQLVVQPVRRHDHPPRREQHGQEQPRLRSADRDLLAATPQLDAAEHPEVESVQHRHHCCKRACKALASVGKWLARTSPAARKPRVDTRDVIRTDSTRRPSMPLVSVKVIKGVFDTEQKQDMISRVTDAMVSIEGEALRELTCVTVEEVESGDWGIGGRAVTAQDVKDRQGAPATAAR